MEVQLQEFERLDDLQNGYEIIQNSEKFCFGMDAVLLSDFSVVRYGETALDLCTGTGIIPILLRAKTQGRSFKGIEIQEDCVNMARRSVRHNHLESEIEIQQGDIREASAIYGRASFDVVTCNPPYMIQSHGLRNPDYAKAVARHEILCTLEDVIRESKLLLRPGGRLYLVHRPFRLAEIMTVMGEYRLEPKKLRLVYPYIDKNPNLVLIEAVSGGNSGLQIDQPFVLYERPGVWTENMRRAYGRI